jgi:molybdopterin converting factor small subunit
VATVIFSRGLQQYTDGTERLEVQAGTVRDVIAQVVARFPSLEDRLDASTAVSIDGEIINEPLLERVGPASEVHFLPSISGG